MQTITKRSFILDQDDIKEALADYINRVVNFVNVETMQVAFDFGMIERKNMPKITVTDGDC